MSISHSKKAWKFYFVYAVHAALSIPLFLNIYLVWRPISDLTVCRLVEIMPKYRLPWILHFLELPYPSRGVERRPESSVVPLGTPSRLSCLWHCCLLMLTDEPRGVWFQYSPEKSLLVPVFYPQNERIWGCSSKTCSLGEVWLQKNNLVIGFWHRPVGISTSALIE